MLIQRQRQRQRQRAQKRLRLQGLRRRGNQDARPASPKTSCRISISLSPNFRTSTCSARFKNSATGNSSLRKPIGRRRGAPGFAAVETPANTPRSMARGGTMGFKPSTLTELQALRKRGEKPYGPVIVGDESA